jgi:hypothetical protein
VQTNTIDPDMQESDVEVSASLQEADESEEDLQALNVNQTVMYDNDDPVTD